MIITSKRDEQGMRAAGKAIAQIREALVQTIRPGMSARELDEIAGDLMEERRVISAPKADYQFPGFICISVNDCVAHGVPDERTFAEGDAVNLDISGSLDGYYADTGISVLLGEDELKEKVICCSQEMFEAGSAFLKPKTYLREMAGAMEQCAQQYGFSVIKKLCGHGIGKRLHDIPHKIYCHPLKWDNRRFRKNMVVAIETFVAAGEGDSTIAEDKWSWITCDHSPTAQYEHTVLITEDGPEILTR